MEKIGFYCSSISWGGLEMNFVKSAIWLSERNYAIKLYCVKDSPIANFVKDTTIDVTYVNRNKKYFDFKNASRLKKLVKKDNIKALWLRDNRDLSTVGIAKTLSRNKFKIIYHQAMQIGVNKKDFMHTLRFKKIDAWIALLNTLADQVKTHTKFDPNKIHVVPLAVDIDETVVENANLLARQKFGLSTDKFVIGIIGRISDQKGQLFLVKELAKLRNENLDIELLIVGESTRGEGEDHMNKIIETVKTLKLENFVHFHPFLKTPKVFYNAVDLFVMASTGETFGTVTIEAMKSGVTILGTNAGGTTEILGNGEFGYLYDVDNSDDFRKNVHYILSNAEKVKTKTIVAQQNAQQQYSKDSVCNKFETIIATLDLVNCKQQ